MGIALNEAMNQDPNLVWDLEEFENHKRAASFVRQFQDTLCVYSGGVEQLYTNYDVSVPRDQEKNLIILPNPYAFHDTFNRVNHDAVRPTKFVIMPGEVAGGKGLHIRIPFNNRKARTVPLANGLRALMRAYENEEDYFLPVIAKGDLRAFRRDLPVLHLHRLMPSKLAHASPFDAKDMRKTILYRLTPYLA